MASNFRISVHQNSDNLHVKLIGDFDGSSACQLINLLKANAYHISKVFIHTNSLNQIHPFGRQVFCNNLHDIHRGYINFVFTGKMASQLEP